MAATVASSGSNAAAAPFAPPSPGGETVMSNPTFTGEHHTGSRGSDATTSGFLPGRRVSEAALPDPAVAEEGMRREWNFSLSIAHEAARVVLKCSPQWEPGYIALERVQDRQHLARDIRHCPLTPAIRYTDRSAVVQQVANATSTTAAAGGGGGDDAVNGHSAPGTADAEKDLLNESLHATANGHNGEEEALWLEKAKHVELQYAHLPPDGSLKAFCINCVQNIVKDPLVVCVDGETDLGHLHLGRKLRCSFRLGGHRSFQFYYRLQNKSQLMNDCVYALGTVAGQHGYLVTVRCSDPKELEGYVRRLFLPHYTSHSKVKLDVDVSYTKAGGGGGGGGSLTQNDLLSEQRAWYGELRYEDRDAATSFCFPVHPMKIKPDYSPAKTVGVGSIACMTLELQVHERLIEDLAVVDITGMPPNKINDVVLCLDVEDVGRMGYPSIMSTEQYSEHKAQRLLDVFSDAKVLGLPATVPLGGRVGRSRTITFTYEPFGGVAKAMLVSTLVGNFGFTALYLTKLGGGVFDTYLYLYQELLNRVTYRQQSTATAAFSRYHVANIRLLEPDLARAYSSAPVDARQFLTKHLQLMHASTDGRVEGGVEVHVPPEEGGVARRGWGGDGAGASLGFNPAMSIAAASQLAYPAAAAAASARLSMTTTGSLFMDSIPLGGDRRRASYTNSLRGFAPAASMTGPLYGAGDGGGGELPPLWETAVPLGMSMRGADAVGGFPPPQGYHTHHTDEDDDGLEHSVSLHSQSLISVSSVTRLLPTPGLLGGSPDDAVATGEKAEAEEAGAGGGEGETASTTEESRERERLRPHTKAALAAAGAEETEGEMGADHPVDGTGGGGAGQPSPSPPQPALSSATTLAAAPHGSGTSPGDTMASVPGANKNHPMVSFTQPPDTTGRATTTTAAAGALSFPSAANDGEHAPLSGTISIPAVLPITSDDNTPITASEEPDVGAVLSSEEHQMQLAAMAADAGVTNALRDDDADLYFGPSLRDAYVRCCDVQHCRPNSYLLQKLPTNPRFTGSVEEIDLTANYLGRNGFTALLHLLELLPRLQQVRFNNMALDNVDAENVCEALARLPMVHTVELCNNPKITLPATRYFTRLLRTNRHITRLMLSGTRLGEAVISRLEAEAAQNGRGQGSETHGTWTVPSDSGGCDGER